MIDWSKVHQVQTRITAGRRVVTVTLADGTTQEHAEHGDFLRSNSFCSRLVTENETYVFVDTWYHFDPDHFERFPECGGVRKDCHVIMKRWPAPITTQEHPHGTTTH